MPVRLLSLLLFAGAAHSVAGHAGAADLRREAEAFAGRPVAVDPRLRVPDCAYDLGWRGDRRAVVAQCAGWRVVLPIAAAGSPPDAPAIRRGDPVQVEAVGGGYRLLVDGIADGPARPGGRVVVRNLQSGRRMIAEMGTDGVLRLAGKSGSPGT